MNLNFITRVSNPFLQSRALLFGFPIKHIYIGKQFWGIRDQKGCSNIPRTLVNLFCCLVNEFSYIVYCLLLFKKTPKYDIRLLLLTSMFDLLGDVYVRNTDYVSSSSFEFLN